MNQIDNMIFMGKLKEKIDEHWSNYCVVYVCVSILIGAVIIIASLSYCLIVKPVRNETRKIDSPTAVKVFINQNDSIIPQLQTDIQELKGMIKEMQNDTLHVMITKEKGK